MPAKSTTEAVSKAHAAIQFAQRERGAVRRVQKGVASLRHCAKNRSRDQAACRLPAAAMEAKRKANEDAAAALALADEHDLGRPVTVPYAPSQYSRRAFPVHTRPLTKAARKRQQLRDRAPTGPGAALSAPATQASARVRAGRHHAAPSLFLSLLCVSHRMARRRSPLERRGLGSG